MSRIRFTLLLILALVLFSALPLSAQSPVQIRIMANFADNSLVLFEDIVQRFESENPDIDVVVDVVPYSTILESLPLQLETGQGPDIAHLTNIAGAARFYLDMRPYVTDEAYWDANFAPTIRLTNPDGGNAISAVHADTTVSGPFINRTLFEQAGVPVPSDESDRVTWDEWAEAARAVRDATGVPFAMAMDRSGHRFAGPAISEGARYFNDEGYPTLLGDEGFRRMAERMVQWHADGTMPLDVWAGGDSYRDARNEFINGQLVFYFTGNWQIGGFQDLIGDAFDWEAVPNPCGASACSGMPGGSVLAAIGATRHPEEVTRFMEYFASEPIYREWAETNLLIPQHTGLIEAGLNFNVRVPQAQAALELFAQQTTMVSEVAVQLQSYQFNTLLFNIPRDRLTQVFVGELTLDEAIAAMQQDIDTALQQQQS